MPFVGLVGAPLSYAEWAALRGGATALAPIAEAASVAAVAAVLAEGALIVGAGLAGYAIGSYILSKLSPSTVYPPAQGLYKIGNPGETWRVRGKSQLQGQAEVFYDNHFAAPILVPLQTTINDTQILIYARVGNTSEKQGYFTYNPGELLEPWTLISAELETPSKGGTVTKIPSLPSVEPLAPFKMPTTIPVPGITPDFPITPTVIPNPNNDPDEDNKQAEPGIIVQIPETGQQIVFTPTGVSIQNYRNPETDTKLPPKVPLPPTFPPPATEPCPCPEEKDASKEIICRLKTLQKEILNDGFITETHFLGAASGTEVDGLPDEFFSLEIQCTQVPVNVRKQSYNSPANDAVWVGWYAWIVGGVPGQRISMQFTHVIDIPPQGCNGYMIGMNRGCLASSLALTRKKKDYVDLCATSA